MTADDTLSWIAWVVIAIAVVVFAVMAIVEGDPPPTTTTGPPTTSTTTTESPTTSSSTTTTVDPTTTTMSPGELPAAIDCRDERRERFDINVNNADTDEDMWATLQYCRELPYEVDQTGGDRYGWDPGDRMGYQCAYGFSWDSHFPEEWQARVTVVQTAEGGYARVNDRYIPDGVLTWAGHESSVGGAEIGDCPHPAEGDYTVDACLGAAPVVAIWHDHHLVDVRDFTSTDTPDHVEFCLLDHITEPFQAVGDGIKARENGFECPAPPEQDPGWGCVEHTVHERVVVGFVVRVDGEQVIPAVTYYDALTPATRFEVQ